jgi:hypothetical protein
MSDAELILGMKNFSRKPAELVSRDYTPGSTWVHSGIATELTESTEKSACKRFLRLDVCGSIFPFKFDPCKLQILLLCVLCDLCGSSSGSFISPYFTLK